VYTPIFANNIHHLLNSYYLPDVKFSCDFKVSMMKTVKQHRIGAKGRGSAVEGYYIDLSTVHVQVS
jgi:hypothetical protein